MRTIFEIKPAYVAALRAAGLADFDALLRAPGGPPTSKHAHRETLPIDIEVDGSPRRFFLKRVFRVPPKHAFWPMFRMQSTFSQPAVEWHMCHELEQAGIPVMNPVAFGERRVCGLPRQALLLVETVPMQHTLENWLVPGFPRPPAIEKRLRDRLLYELGALIRRLLSAGFDWPDLNAKHIYAAPRTNANGSSQWDFRLIDVERMTRGDAIVDSFLLEHDESGSVPLPPDRVVRSLKKLLTSLQPMAVTRSDYWRLMAGLCLPPTPRGDQPRMDPAHQASMYEAAGGGEMPRLPDDYEHPCCVPLKKLGKMLADERAIPWLQSVGLNSFEDVFQFNGGHRMGKPGLAPHRDRTRMELTNNAGEKRTFYLKRHVHPPLIEQIRRIRECGHKISSGGREVLFNKRLSMLGIPTMRGVAFGQRMNGVFEERSFGITEEVAGESLETFTEQIAADPLKTPPWAQRREIIRQLALLAGRLHKNKLFHRDLYLCHIFLTHNGDGNVVLRLIDLARMIAKPASPGRWIIKDLASLDYSAAAGVVTRADRLRFLYHYEGARTGTQPLKGRSLSRQKTRFYIQNIQARTRRMARHDVHRAKRFEGGVQT